MSDHTEERIKLAEMMGWWLFKEIYWQPPEVTKEFADNAWSENRHIRWDATPLPDPFTDANDDYAVLEWARTNPEGFGICHDGKWMGFTTFMHMNEQEAHQYRIGDFARAALGAK